MKVYNHVCPVKRSVLVAKMNFTLRKIVLMMMGSFFFLGQTHAETISPRRLLELADISGAVISPDGKNVAFRLEQAHVDRNIYDSAWYVQSLDGTSPPRRVADGGIPQRDSAGISIPPIAIWSKDGRWIFFRAFLDGKIDVWRAAVDGSVAEPLTHDLADVRNFTLNVQGQELIYSVGATREEVFAKEQSEYDRGIHIDGMVPIGQGLFRSSNVEGRWSSQRYYGIWFGRASLLADIPDRWKAVDLTTLAKRDLSQNEIPESPLEASKLPGNLSEPWKLVSDPVKKRIALLIKIGDSEGLREKPAVQLATLSSNKGGGLTECTAELCVDQAISDIRWRPLSDEVLFTVTDPHEGRAQSIYRWNVETGIVHPVVRSRGLINGGREQSSPCAISAERLACVTADADHPPRLESIDIVTGTRKVLFEPNLSLALDIAIRVPAKFIRWTDEKGQEFTGQLFQARKNGKLPPPLFVTYYSCTGFLRGGLGDEWPLMSLAEQGISALCINSPPGYPLDAVERYSRGLSAVQSVVELLASKGEINPGKVGMGGLSFGSEVTLWTAMHSNLLVAASITSPSIEPNYYLFNRLRNETFFEELKRSWGLGSPLETPERWKVISPALNTDKIKTPVLLQMPEQEYLYALEFALPLIRGERADLYVFPNEPHQKFQPKHKLAAYERNLDWFRFWLQDYEDIDPAKNKQYLRWNSMKAKVLQGTTVSQSGM